MLITKRAHGKVTVIHLTGKFEGGPDREKLLKLTAGLVDDGCRDIVVSFLGVRFLASNGVGIMIAMKTLMDAAGGRMVLCNLNERNLAVMYIMRLQEIFTIETNIRNALQRLRATRTAEAGA
jgi:anti-anti-sigma factor